MSETIKDLEWLDDLKPTGTFRREIKTKKSPTGKIAFIGKVATDENAEYAAAISKVQNSKEYIEKYLMRETPPSPEDTAELRRMDKEIFANHVFVDWELTNAKGEKVPYSPELAVKVLDKIPNGMWKSLEMAFSNEANFTGGSLTKKEAEAAGNA